MPTNEELNDPQAVLKAMLDRLGGELQLLYDTKKTIPHGELARRVNIAYTHLETATLFLSNCVK